ncbi:ATP-dependent DNA helicase Q4 [Ischnura elegans]|uniref:ATP-dependent DNA helicase Q4 n=1 Tax=Ischnura elegans TaxID=197161 RepID=UPI001ED8754D|nr:ATP-dependent DNA helicase Q4 [Ischnura elegans]
MASFDEPLFKLKYQKYKLKVKLWESEFRKTNGRIPAKDDIKSASPDIREAYRKYWKLKTLNLQRTILDPMLLVEDESSALTFDDVKSTSETNSLFSSKFESVNGDSSMSITFEPTEDSQASLNCVVESRLNIKSPVPPCEELQVSQKDANVWGPHLNKQKEVKADNTDTISVKPSSSSQLSKKLFGGSKFNLKRNPRKSSSFSQRSKSDINIRPISVSLQPSSKLYSSQEAAPSKPVHFDSPPLEDSLDFLIVTPSENRPFKVIKSNEHLSRNSISIIDQAISEPKALKTRQLNDGWVKRHSLIGISRIENDPISGNELNNSLNSGEEQENISSTESKVEVDDDLVSDSDTESSQKTSFFQACMKRKKISDKTQDVEDCDNRTEMRPGKIQKRISSPSESDVSAAKESSNVVVSLPKTVLKKLSQATDDSFDSSKSKPENGESKAKKSSNSKAKALERKLASGTVNENFVKINIKKKVYARGKKNTSFSKYKKMMYKKKANKDGDELCGKNIVKCFKCGDIGHYARNCMKVDKLLPTEENEEDASEFPTLEEVALMCKEAKEAKSVWDTGSTDQLNEGGHKDENEEIVFTIEVENSCPSREVKPVYQLLEGGSLIDTPKEIYDTLKMFGHEEFRPGQEEAIMRVLSGQSTLLMLSTGAGKSLCYQLPSYIYAQKSKSITVVVSPLVSLMEDQVLGLPSFLKAACLHTNQTAKQREKVLEQVKKGNMHFLLVSPEAVVGSTGGGKGSNINFRNFLAHLPPIAFACIDEAHCVSQWSHNFRPSYLMVCKILRENLGVKTILGLTATATKTTAFSIASHLEIADGEKGIIKGIPLPNNLMLSASEDKFKDKALVALMNGERFQDCSSLIIYCTRREECERLSTFIRTQFRDDERPESNARRNRISWNAEAYHAGMSAARRKKVQQAFMNGSLRIVIATVAFGMGINKQNIRGIIHYNMPSNIESYVQEVGRAGRDGLTAHCHVFLDENGGDLHELRRHIHSDSIDRHTIRKLLQKVFVPCTCVSSVQNTKSKGEMDDGNGVESEVSSGCSASEKITCPGHEVAIPVDETINALDIPEENIATLLCYLELHPKRWIKVLNRVYTKCKVQCYQGPKQLKEAARKCPALAMAIAFDLERGVTHEKSNSIEFPVVEISSRMGWESGLVKKHLKDLEWKKGPGGRWSRSGILVEFSVLGFHFVAPGNLLPSELDEALDSLHNRVVAQEEASLKQLNTILSALNMVSHKTCKECSDEVDEERSNKLKDYINKYFREEIQVDLPPAENLSNEGLVRDDIRQLVCSFRDQSFTGRAVARILHGISSPCFPAYVWGRTRFWRLHLPSDFRTICKVATDEILKLR